MRLLPQHFIVIIFSCFSYSLTSHAEINFPTPSNYYINDFANIINEVDKAALNKQLESVEKQTGIEIVVVTINLMADYGYTQTAIESFATDLFNNWSIGGSRSGIGGASGSLIS